MPTILRPGAATLLVFALALSATAADAQRRVEVYKVKYRTAEEMLPVVETVMAGSGSAALDRGTNSLVLVGAPDAVSDALALLAAADRRLRTVVLRYDTKRVRDLEEQGFHVRFSAAAGDFRVGNVARPPGSGSSVAVRVDEEMLRLADSLRGTVRVTEGERARIETGTSVPYATRSPDGTHTEFVTAATGFEASARILGDGRVQVDLAAFAGSLGRRPGASGSIETMNAGTLVTLTPGETLVVGGLDASSDAEQRGSFAGANSASLRDDTVLLLRADVE